MQAPSGLFRSFDSQLFACEFEDRRAFSVRTGQLFSGLNRVGNHLARQIGILGPQLRGRNSANVTSRGGVIRLKRG